MHRSARTGWLATGEAVEAPRQSQGNSQRQLPLGPKPARTDLMRREYFARLNAPRLPIPSIGPIFIADKVTITVSRENDGKLWIVYAGWDRRSFSCSVRRSLAEADSGPFMTSGPDPL